VEDPEIFALLEPLVGSQGLDLVEVAISGGRSRAIVRLVVLSEAGVTHGDCARVTRAAGAVLDEAGAFPGSYVLEVWSPGTDRVLRAPREFDLFRGRMVQVMLADEAAPRVGRAAGTRGPEEVALARDDGGEDVLAWSVVVKARLIPEPPAKGAQRG
jgi:ribosome maturation factor RimP